MVEGSVNGYAFQTPLEPDGMGSHWFRVSNTMLKAARAKVGDSVSVALEPMAVWSEPTVPADLAEALGCDPGARRIWLDITTLARWDWIHWIGSTKNRQHESSVRRSVEGGVLHDRPVGSRPHIHRRARPPRRSHGHRRVWHMAVRLRRSIQRTVVEDAAGWERVLGARRHESLCRNGCGARSGTDIRLWAHRYAICESLGRTKAPKAMTRNPPA